MPTKTDHALHLSITTQRLTINCNGDGTEEGLEERSTRVITQEAGE